MTQALGEHSGALALQRESLAIRQEIGDRWGIGRTLDSIGTVLLALGERQAAKRHFREALKSAMKIEATPQAVEVLVSMAQLLAHEGEGERAVAVLAFALHHEAGIGEIKGRAKRLLFELEPQLSATSFAKAVEEGKHKRLQEVVEGLLAQA